MKLGTVRASSMSIRGRKHRNAALRTTELRDSILWVDAVLQERDRRRRHSRSKNMIACLQERAGRRFYAWAIRPGAQTKRQAISGRRGPGTAEETYQLCSKSHRFLHKTNVVCCYFSLGRS